MPLQADPAARALLAELLHLETTPWPAARPAYDSALLALASRCVQPAGKAEVYRWFRRRAGGALQVHSEVMRECLRDALADIVARAPTFFLRLRAGLRSDRRPNVQSMLVRAVTWHANELHISQYRRHDKRRARAVDRSDDAWHPIAPEPFGQVAARQLLGQLIADDSPQCRFLALIALGHSVLDAARRAGVDRKTIYDLRAKWRDGGPGG